MAGIFINYRRADTQPWALGLFDKLVAKFGRDRVFMDIDTLEPGEDFFEKIEETLAECDVMVVLIGRNWLIVSDQTGRPRLENPDDWVRVEIEAGLKRRIRVIPVLLDGVEMPGSRDLPETLKVLARKNALEVSPTRYRHDVERLIRPLEKLLDKDRGPKPIIEEIPTPHIAPTPAKSSPREELKTGDTRVNPKDGLTYVWIPPGDFLMGATPGDDQASGNEKPQHPVWITRGFWRSQGPVTVAAYKKYVGDTGAQLPAPPTFNPGWSKGDHPVVCVNWEDAVAFCKWAGGRLPTEAEWEYAAGGGKKNLKYPWGNTIRPGLAANGAGSEWDCTSPVGGYAANHFGLHDMSGTVWEWTSDWYNENYYLTLVLDEPTVDPQGPSGGSDRTTRGGSWLSNTSDLRTARRTGFLPADRSNLVGFRCALDVFP